MADPLSTAASVVGLLTAAVQISQVLTTVINKARHAPEECKRIKAEVDDITNVLGSLQLFITGVSRAPRARTSLIMVDQVVATLAATVTTFSELDAFATALQIESEMNLLDRLRWVSKDKEIKSVLVRMESHKSSLLLMLTILTCQSQDDAESRVDRLCDLVEQMLSQNITLKQRLAALEVQEETPKQIEMIESRLNEQTLENDDTEGNLAPDPDLIGVAERPNWQRNAQGFAFEEILMSSRVYRFASRNNSDGLSIITSAGRTASWSMLSGLSLSEVSHIGIQAIPIYASDITNKDHYDFTPNSISPIAPQKLPNSSSDGVGKSSRRKRFKDLLRVSRSGEPEPEPAPVVFGVPLRTSINYANVAISRFDADGQAFVYGYIPIAVAKPGVFLKEQGQFERLLGYQMEVLWTNGGLKSGTEVEDIFAINGNPVRMSHLQSAFDSPPRYGKSLVWDDYTVHDAAGLFLRYLKSLPEPLIPYEHYEKCIAEFTPFIDRELDSEESDSILSLGKTLMTELPPLNRQLLLYVLDIMGVFAAKSEQNKMTGLRLVSVFQPSILSGPPPVMDAEAHHVAAQIAALLVEYEARILFSMD